MERIMEAGREIPVVLRTDVVVAGGGPAGVAAALASARAGARTAIIEGHGCLGGVWTSGSLGWLLDHRNKAGIMREIVERLRTSGGLMDEGFGANGADPEVMKLVLEGLCVEAGVRIRYHTRVVAVIDGPGDSIASVVTESKSGREAWSASHFIDATGDGDLAARAGCTWEWGREEADGTRRGQPLSLIALLTGLPAGAMAGFIHDGSVPYGEDSRALMQALSRSGIQPSYQHPVLLPVAPGLYALMAGHEYGASGLDADHVTMATVHARADIHRIVDGLRRAGGVLGSLRLVGTAAQIGIREGRRVKGRYRIAVTDAIEGRRHADAVCRVTFPIDIHATDPGKGKGFGNEGLTARPFDIPLRALMSADRSNLLLAGRCISGDFAAHGSYRVTGNAVCMGEAAGACAALCSRLGCRPDRLDLAAFRSLVPEPLAGPGHGDALQAQGERS